LHPREGGAIKLRANHQSRIGFIAMWFDDSMKAAWITIENGMPCREFVPESKLK
jgi:hypothetical protein